MANNQKIKSLLTANKQLLHPENQKLVQEFLLHIDEFNQTRATRESSRVSLFPQAVNSVFGVEQYIESLAPSVSALQNLIAHLVHEDRFVSLQLVDSQFLTYRESGNQKQLDLNDRPKVQQIYWTGGFYRPQTTKLRLDGLVFVLSPNPPKDGV